MLIGRATHVGLDRAGRNGVRSTEPGRRRRLLSILGLAGPATLVLLCASGSAAPPSSARQSGPRFRGHVIPSRLVELKAPLEETLRRIEVAEGDRVKAGQLLAVLDDRLQTVVVEASRLRAQSRAELERTALDVEEADDHFRRVTDAFEKGAATDSELRRARIATKRADALHTEALENRALAQVSLKLERRRLARYRIVAPFAGTVVRVESEIGAMLTVDDPVLVLADLDTLEGQVNLPASVYGQLTVGDSYAFTAGGPVNGQLTGILKTVDPVIDTASQTFRCVFTIPNAQTRFPAGFAVYLSRAPMPGPGSSLTSAPGARQPLVTPRGR